MQASDLRPVCDLLTDGRIGPNVSGIYGIVTPSGKIYVGQAGNIAVRWREHRRLLEKRSHVNAHLQRSWDKYGEENIGFLVLEECEQSVIDAKEEHYIRLWRGRTLNILQHARSVKGYKHTPESRAKMRANQPRKRAVTLADGTEFTSLSDFARACGISPFNIHRRLRLYTVDEFARKRGILK